MIAAVTFLTVVGRGRPPDEHTLRWFPPVGALIGGVLGLAWWGLATVFPPGVAALLVIGLDLGLTGMLHVDGLADSADGLLPHLPPARRLEVMRQPAVGAFAVAVLTVTLLARWASLTTEAFAPVALVAVWAMARAVAAAVPAVVAYARPDGLATSFLGGSSRWIAAWVLPCVVLLGVTEGAAGIAAGCVSVVAGVGVVALAVRRLGGFTGDVLGALIVMTETAALLTMTARH